MLSFVAEKNAKELLITYWAVYLEAGEVAVVLSMDERIQSYKKQV